MGSTPPSPSADAQRAASRLRRRYLTARRSKYLTGEELLEQAEWGKRTTATGTTTNRLVLIKKAQSGSFEDFVAYLTAGSEGYGPRTYRQEIEKLEKEAEDFPWDLVGYEGDLGMASGIASDSDLERRVQKYEDMGLRVEVKSRVPAIRRKIKRLEKKDKGDQALYRKRYDLYRKRDITHHWIGGSRFILMDHEEIVGSLDIGTTAIKSSFQKFLENSRCPEDMRDLGEIYGPAEVFKVVRADLDWAYRRSGLGKLMYQQVIYDLKKRNSQGFYFIPDKCGSIGSTTEAASRVWKSLAKKYPSSGECLAIGLHPLKRTASEARWFRGVHSRNKGLFYRGARGTGPNDGSGLGALGNGVYLTWSKPMAEFFAERSRGQVYTYKVPSNLKLLDAQSEEMADIKAEFGFAPHEYSNDPAYARIVTKAVKDLGYDGVISDNQADGLVVFDPRKLEIIGV